MSLSANEIKRIVEAVLFNQDKPVSITKLQQQLFQEIPVSKMEIEDAIIKLQAEYKAKSIELVEVANGFIFRTKAQYGPWLSLMWQEKPPKYSRAVLETLALIAYQQPITRGQIEDIRGVSVSSHIIKTLSERGWIKVVGHKEVPGRPAMYGTEKTFLDYFGLKSLADLPKLEEPESIENISKRLASEFNDSSTKENTEYIN
jgi:segregation and condensation protein B